MKRIFIVVLVGLLSGCGLTTHTRTVFTTNNLTTGSNVKEVKKVVGNVGHVLKKDSVNSVNKVSVTGDDNLAKKLILLCSNDPLYSLSKEELNKLTEQDKEKVENYCNKQRSSMEENIKMMSNLEQAEKRVDLSYCDKKGDLYFPSKEECKIKFLLSKDNKLGCDLAKKEGDEKLYEECLRIKKSIKLYQQVEEGKKYYELLNSSGY